MLLVHKATGCQMKNLTGSAGAAGVEAPLPMAIYQSYVQKVTRVDNSTCAITAAFTEGGIRNSDRKRKH
jgi:hypothetical protein